VGHLEERENNTRK